MRSGLGVLWTLILFGACASGQENERRPRLVFDAGGHTAAINKVRFVGDNRLVTVSNDKTARIWSVRTGEPLNVLRVPAGPGPAGMLNAVAVSNDGRFLAVGGYEFSGANHGIYLIDLLTSRMITVLRGHTNVIVDLRFSSDDRLLASASVDKTARLWDTRGWRNLATLRGHRDAVYAVTFSPDNRQLATASLDKTARIWSIESAAELEVFRGHTAPLQSIDWSRDNNQLATGSANQAIDLWQPDGSLARRFEKLGNDVTAVQFVKNSAELFYTLGGSGASDGGFLIDLATNRRHVKFTGHENSVLDGAVSANGSLAATADANGVVCIWRTADGSLVHRLMSRGRRPWGIAWGPDGNTIAWGNTSDSTDLNHRGPLEFAFRLKDLEFVPLVGNHMSRARTHIGSTSIRVLDPTTLAVTSTRRNAVRLSLGDARDAVRCFTLLDERTAAVGSDFGLFLYDTLSGRRTRSLKGHGGGAWALAPSPDGRYLLSATDDRSLRVWNWRNGQQLLSMFFAGRQWIAWTPEGYYAASPGGETLMGWLVNNGPSRLGTYYPAAKFRGSLYRPALIRRLLDAGNVQQVLNTAQPNRPAGSQAVTVEQVLPPVVKITEPAENPIVLTQPTVRIRAAAHSRGEHPITSLRLLLDGRPYEGRKGVHVVPLQSDQARGVSGQWTVELASGRHQLAVQAETRASQGLSSPLEITYRPKTTTATTRLPDLYVLAIGIAAYPGSLRLNYAAKDAIAFANTLQRVSKPLFRNVKIRLLTDQQATRRDILKGLSWLRREMTQRDVAVFFYSGHGTKDETGNFYLVPIDGEPADLLTTGVSGGQFKDALAAIAGRVLVLLDACHAGAAGGDRRKAVRVMTDDLVRDLVTDDYGIIVMCSSMGREYSMESEQHQQGYFTLALIEALQGKCDYNQDGLVYLTEMDAYLADRVKVLTQGQQHPVTTKPTSIRSFPIGKVLDNG